MAANVLPPMEPVEPKRTSWRTPRRHASEGASEKHLPIIETDGNRVTVKVGSIFHPMSEEHNIGWVCLETEAGVTMRVPLDSACDPVAYFTLEDGDAPKAAYAWCNLHGFWKGEG